MQCTICNFDFEKVYGILDKNKIHAHHSKTLSEIKGNYIIDPINDLVPVCPNCHFISQSKSVPYSIEEIMEIMSRNK